MFPGGKTRENTQRLIIDAKVSNLHFLPPPGVSLVTSEGLSRVEVTLENDDVDPGELSRLTGWHLGLADMKDASHLFCPSRGGRAGSGSPLVGCVCSCFSSLPMGHTWNLFFCQKAIEEAMWATPSLDKAEILQDTWSCVVPRPSDENNDTEFSRRVSKKFCHVYVDNLGVLGTSRVNFDEDLMMAIQTLKESRSGHTRGDCSLKLGHRAWDSHGSAATCL